ncbi:MAG TPA: penicillin-binding transpeptidase domain-containing protein [Ktedonobacterales bacterium]|nr:penicillin-binding transpeptidase domain-containing protein [Ktedonobacterales bacterium]
MNTSMTVTIRRLMNAFIIIFLVISGVAAYVQVGNQAFFNGPLLAGGNYETLARKCPPVDSPLRGRILDRNGNVIAETVPDDAKSGAYTCGYHRVYAQRAIDDGLAPLIGYYTYAYGAGGLEQTLNNDLSGNSLASVIPIKDQIRAKLLHSAQYGNDIYLTIDKNVQDAAAKYYDRSAIIDPSPNGVCQKQAGLIGSVTVEDPNTGQIVAMYSYPSYDPNKIEQADSRDPALQAAAQAYWKQLNQDARAPLLNKASQGLFVPGSSFKTLTLIAGLDSGKYALDTQFSFADATDFKVPQGEDIPWYDYFNGVWKGRLSNGDFPITTTQGFAFSDNPLFARMAYNTGADTWLSYARKFGIATPGTSSPAVPFDGPSAQSIAYNAITSGKPTSFSGDLLAESGFGQGQLLVSPLTMTEITATVAANGYLYEPHAVMKVVAHGQNAADVSPTNDKVAFGGGPIIQPQTATAVRQAMYAVVNYGTANYGLPPDPLTGNVLKFTGTHVGGKTGTGQLQSGDPNAWWISLAPDDQAPGAPGGAQYAMTVMKAHGGEGACQVYVADDVYQYLFAHPPK